MKFRGLGGRWALFLCLSAAPSLGAVNQCQDLESFLFRTLKKLTAVQAGSFVDRFAARMEVGQIDPVVLLDCLAFEGVTSNRVDLLILLQGIFEKIGTSEAAAEWADGSYLRHFLDRVGFTAQTTLQRKTLEFRFSENVARWNRFEAKAEKLFEESWRLRRTMGSISLRLFAYQAILTAALLGDLVYQEVIPEKYCTPSGLIGVCATVSAVAVKKAWPLWKATLLNVLASPQFLQVEKALRDVAMEHRDVGLYYLTELGTIHDQPGPPAASAWGTAGQRLGRNALSGIEGDDATEHLIELSIRYLRNGYLEAGISTLNEVLRRRGINTDATELAEAVKKAVASRDEFEKKLSDLKKERLFWRVMGTVAVVGGGSLVVSALRVDPMWIAAAQSSALSVASAVGMGKLVSYVWLNFPERKLRKKLKGEIRALENTFAAVGQLCPDLALPFLEGIAAPDKRTHPFIREAAFGAILRVVDPSTADRLRRIMAESIQAGDFGFAEEVMGKLIGRNIECNEAIAGLGVPLDGLGFGNSSVD